MNWKQELDALIESTMAFARDVKRQPIPDFPVAMRTAEQTPADRRGLRWRAKHYPQKKPKPRFVK